VTETTTYQLCEQQLLNPMDYRLQRRHNRNGFGVHMGLSERGGVVGIDFHHSSLPTSPLTACVN